MRSRSKVLLTAAVTVPLVLGTAGTAYAAHFQSRALPGSTLAGVSVAGLTRAEVGERVRERAAGVTVALEAGSTRRALPLADLGAVVDVDATVDAVFAANAQWSSYATSLLSPREVDAVVRTDTDTTDRVVAEAVGAAGRQGADAKVRLAGDKRSFAVVPAVAGETIVPASFRNAVATAGHTLTSGTAQVRFAPTDSAASTRAATEAVAAANALVDSKVSVSDGTQAHTASAKTKASWVTIPTTDGTFGTPTVDAAKVRTWVDKQADAAKVEVRTGLRYVDSAGTVRLVRTEARDGRTVSNAAAVASALRARLTAGKAYSGSFDYSAQEATWTERRIAAGAENLAYPAADGEKWVDVDLTEHTMAAYVGAKRVYGPVKMVNGSDKKPTVVGTFPVYLKYEKQTMRGSNADGSQYETPDVPWISYFHNGFALHGAPWRTSFGYAGERGSHGCINLPVPVAKWVYDFATVGTVVTTHH